jgi:hypothetical protein
MGYTAVGELPFKLQEGGEALAWQPSLDVDIDHDQIMVHTDRCRRIARVAGLGGIVVQHHSGKRSAPPLAESYAAYVDYDSENDDVDELPAPVRATKPKPSRLYVGVDHSDGLLQPEYNWPVGRININNSALGNRVLHRVMGGQSQREALANEYDSLLRKGIFNLINDVAADQYFNIGALEPFMFASYTFACSQEASHGNALAAAGIALGVQAGKTLFSMAMNKHFTGDHHLADKRWSVFPSGMQPDRWIAALAMASVLPLVKHRP